MTGDETSPVAIFGNGHWHRAVLYQREIAARGIRHMNPKDAFASYANKNGKMILTHIEVPPEHRGTGIGGRFAKEVLAEVVKSGRPASITCSFLRRVAASKPEWADYFLK